MKKIKVYVEPHDGADKSFRLSFEEFSAQVDYDDVNHTAVDASVEVLKSLIEKHWDKKDYEEVYRKKLLEEWERNEYDLQDDYEGLSDYLSQHGFKS